MGPLPNPNNGTGVICNGASEKSDPRIPLRAVHDGPDDRLERRFGWWRGRNGIDARRVERIAVARLQIDQASHAIGMARADRTQFLATEGMPNDYGTADVQLLHDRKYVVSRNEPRLKIRESGSRASAPLHG